MARAPRPAGSEQDDESWTPTDAELGVGEGEEPSQEAVDAAADKMNAAMADPIVKAAIDLLIEQRAAELAGGRSCNANERDSNT